MAIIETRLFDVEPIKQWVQPQTTPWLTKTLIAINVAVFVAMSLAGGGKTIFAPTNKVLVAWQANWAPLTLTGEPWRLFTSCFLHIGLIHIIINMITLWYVGRFCELVFGHQKYFLLYIVSGLAGSVCSNLVITGVCAGASGAISGVIGAYLAFLIAHKNEIDKQILIEALQLTGLYLLSSVFGGVDYGAHFGGIAAGYLLGAAMVPKGIGGFTFGMRDWLITGTITAAIAGPFVLAGALDLTGAASYGRVVRAEKAKNYQEAIQDLQEILKHHPKYRSAYKELAHIYIVLKQPTEVLAVEKQVVKPDTLDCALRAEANYMLLKWDAAIADATEALRYQSKNPYARKIRLLAYLKQGNKRLALTDAEVLLREYPDSKPIRSLYEKLSTQDVNASEQKANETENTNLLEISRPDN